MVPRRQTLQLLDEAIRRDTHFIASHPTALFQCLWNSCWWYDCPIAEGSYDPPPTGWDADGRPWRREGPGLHTLLREWRRALAGRRPGFVWVRSLRPPVIPLGVGLASAFRGHTSLVTGLAFSADGWLLATGSVDGTVRLWETRSGAPQSVIALPAEELFGGIQGVSLSPDGTRVAFNAVTRVFVWDVDRRDVIARIDKEAARCVTISPDGRRVAFAAGGGFAPSGLYILTIDSGEVFKFPSHPRATNSIRFSSDGARILTADEDGLLGIWDVATGEALHCLGGLNSYGVSAATFLADERYVASGVTNGLVEFWDASTGERLGSHDVGEFITGLVALPGDERVVMSHFDGTFRFLDRETGEQWTVAGPGDHGVHKLAISPNGRFVASGSGDGLLQIWDVERARAMPRLPNHKEDISRLALSGDLCSVVSTDGSSTLAWNVVTGLSGDAVPESDGAPSIEFPESPWELVADGWKSVFRHRETGEIRAWFPAAFEHAVKVPWMDIWAASTGGKHLYLLALEEEVE